MKYLIFLFFLALLFGTVTAQELSLEKISLKEKTNQTNLTIVDISKTDLETLGDITETNFDNLSNYSDQDNFAEQNFTFNENFTSLINLSNETILLNKSIDLFNETNNTIKNNLFNETEENQLNNFTQNNHTNETEFLNEIDSNITNSSNHNNDTLNLTSELFENVNQFNESNTSEQNNSEQNILDSWPENIPTGEYFIENDVVTSNIQKTTYLKVNGMLIATNNGQTKYIHNDFLGSPEMSSYDLGSPLYENKYGPFGKQISGKKDSGVGYTGHLFNTESGLIYAGARYYDPQMRIWTTPDPVVRTSTSSYSYVGNNPLNYVDPDGKLELFSQDWNGIRNTVSTTLNEMAAPLVEFFGFGAQKIEETTAPVVESEPVVVATETVIYSASLVEDVSITVSGKVGEKQEGNPVELTGGAQATVSLTSLLQGEGMAALSSAATFSARVDAGNGQSAGGGLSVGDDLNVQGDGAVVSSDIITVSATPDKTSASVSVPVGTLAGGVTSVSAGFSRTSGQTTVSAGASNKWGKGQTSVTVGCKLNCRVRDFSRSELQSRIDRARRE